MCADRESARHPLRGLLGSTSAPRLVFDHCSSRHSGRVLKRVHHTIGSVPGGAFDMNTTLQGRGFLSKLQDNPLDLRQLNVADAARAPLTLSMRHSSRATNARRGRPKALRCWAIAPSGASVEGGPVEWGALLTLGESMWLTEFELRYDHRPDVKLQSSVVGRRAAFSLRCRIDHGMTDEALPPTAEV